MRKTLSLALAAVLAGRLAGCACADADRDGVCDLDDRCPGAPDAADADGDMLPDACDPCPSIPGADRDGDGSCDLVNPCPLDAPDDCNGNGACDAADAYPRDASLRLHETQGKGTHNSYHLEPPIVFDPSHAYSHVPLDDQLQAQGVRTFELDVHRDPQGHRVYHIVGIDPRSTCDGFLDCLHVIGAWSRAHRRHLPIVVWVEPKDDTGGLPLDLDAVDVLVRAAFPGPALLTPDDVQGAHATLREALDLDGWPTLGQARGRAMFVLLDTGGHRDAYTRGGTSLAGRAMFALHDPGEFAQPLAALAKLAPDDAASIQAALAATMLVAANVCTAGDTDAACQQARAAALGNGVHMLKDDFPAPVPGRTSWLDIPGGTPDRCNPVTASALCTSWDLEHLRPAVDVLAGEGLGPSSGSRVRVLSGAGAPALDIVAYGSGAWGVVPAAGDLGADCAAQGVDQILTGPGPGPALGPHVRAFRRDGSAVARVSFYAYGTLRYGVNVAAGNVDGDPYAEILTGAGAGEVFGPHVRGFELDGGTLEAIGKISFFAYTSLRYGVTARAGDVDADGYAEIVTGPGPGPVFAPHVRGFDYDNSLLSAVATLDFWAFPGGGYGVDVTAATVDPEPASELAATRGPGPSFTADFAGFDHDGAGVAALPGFQVTPWGVTLFGGRVGLGDIDGDPAAELLAGPGPDPSAAAVVSPYAYRLGRLGPLPGFTAFTPSSYGVNPGSALLGL